MTRPQPASSAILLMGPTATGKTAVALGLAKRFPIEIISVDSAMVYRGMDIGTAKPTAAERASTIHHLIDIRDPADAYSAGEFRRDSLQLIGEIRSRDRLPLLVGGTMLYFSALTKGLADLPGANTEIRQNLDAEAARSGWPAMHQRLKKIDPVAAARIKPTDAQRIQRALEVFELTGRNITDLQNQSVAEQQVGYLRIALWPDDRERLSGRIDERLDSMLERGFLKEVEALYRRDDLHPDLPAIRAVGYRQLWRYLSGEIGFKQAIDEARVATRRLAKRQMTWLRADETLEMVPVLEDSPLDPINCMVSQWLEIHG